eukprot:768245-Hanusia_phi.AAC.9
MAEKSFDPELLVTKLSGQKSYDPEMDSESLYSEASFDPDRMGEQTFGCCHVRWEMELVDEEENGKGG